MSELTLLLLFLGLLIAGCIVCSKISSRFSMPGLLVFLLIGLLVGIAVPNKEALAPELFVPIFQKHSVGLVADRVGGFLSWEVANAIGTVALVFILFSGGYDSDWKAFRPVLLPGGVMATAGVFLTALMLGLLGFVCFWRLTPVGQEVRFLLTCLLFGAVISSTDASAVFSILRSKKIGLQGELRPLLELESGSNDPMATFLTMFFVGMLARGGGSVSGWRVLTLVPWFVWKMAGGIGVGLLVGRLAAWLFNHLRLDYDGLYYVLGTGVALIAYALADALAANGFMAVYVAGMWMGNHHFLFHNSFGRFADAIAWLMQVLLFTMLGIKANLRLLWELKWVGLGMALFLMLVARPAATFLCLCGRRFSLSAKALTSWVGLRGGAPIMLATYAMMNRSRMLVLDWQDGLNTADAIFALVFIMVLLSVVCQSFTIMPLARLLHLDAPLKVSAPAPIVFEEMNSRLSPDASDFAGTRPREFIVNPGSDFCGREIRNFGLPPDAFIVMVQRGLKYIVPHGNTVIQEGDTLTILGPEAQLREMEVRFRSSAGK